VRLAGRCWRGASPLIPAFAAILILRARFFFTPISTDEGGDLAIGRAWGRGATLYRGVWVGPRARAPVIDRSLDVIGLGASDTS
jgi:hypothetical protein